MDILSFPRKVLKNRRRLEMKKLMPLILVVSFVLFIAGVHFDGNKFEWGYNFRSTDSTRLVSLVTTISGRDTADTYDTLYTPALDMNPDEIQGMWTIRAIIDRVEATGSDSIDLYVRLGTRFSSTKYVWGLWHDVWLGMQTDSLYEKYISQTDSIWFLNATSRQYMLVKRDSLKTGDTLSTVYVTDFLH